MKVQILSWSCIYCISLEEFSVNFRVYLEIVTACISFSWAYYLCEPSTWTAAIHVRDPDRNLDTWLHSGSLPTIAVIWVVHQQMEDLFLFLSLSITLPFQLNLKNKKERYTSCKDLNQLFNTQDSLKIFFK